jgi:putative colanic acid biosynthesis glycosyltransferase
VLKFSIVTVNYNDAKGLCRTCESILFQSFGSFEWIVVDGLSTDDSVGYLQSLDIPFLKWRSEKDGGIYDAMNRGIAMCTGEYVVFMNAGDVFYGNEVLSDVAQMLVVDNQVADILFGGALLSFAGSGRSAYRPPRPAEISLWHGLPANHQATYYRRCLLTQTPYDLKYSLCGDYYLAARLMQNGAFAIYLDAALAIFEVGGQSYKRLGHLFAEPYRIQRDVLRTPFYYRLASVLRRLVSTVGFVVLSQPFFKKSNCQ